MGLAAFRARRALGASRGAGACFAVLTFAGASIAATPEPRPVNLWYRTIDGCPESQEFIAQLEARGVHARVARVGDAVDFVVTLGKSDTGSEGLLERQTPSRAVAIRRLTGDDCRQVAEALALSLVLTANPDGDTTAPPEAESKPGPDSGPGIAAPEPQPGATLDRPPPSATARDSAAWSVGSSGDVTTGVAPSPLVGARLFTEIEAPAIAVLPRAAVRLGATAGFASGEVEATAFDLRIVGGRLEGCPTALGSANLSVKPCLAYEAGVLQTSGEGARGSDDAAFWSAFAVLGRVAWQLNRSLFLEAEAGANFPLTRYELLAAAPPRVAYDMPPIGAAVALGVAFRLP